MQQLIEAWEHYKQAKHLLFVTYPMTNDPKLLLGVVESIHNSMKSALEVQRSNLKKQTPAALEVFQDVQEIVNSHKSSPIEFKRKDKFIICTKDYLLKEISFAKMKSYLDHNYALLHEVVSLVNRK